MKSENPPGCNARGIFVNERSLLHFNGTDEYTFLYQHFSRPCDLELSLQSDISRGTADHDLDFPRLECQFQSFIVEGELIDRQVEDHVTFLARLDGHTDISL